MFFKRELNQISSKNSVSAKQLNDAIDAVGLPYGFQYSKRFLLFGIEWVHKVEKVGEKTYRVPSESKPGKFYNVALDPINCECPAFQRFKVTPYPFCKHIVAAMVKEQDVTDAFFDWLDVKSGDLFDYIQARFIAGTASTSILEPLLPIIPSFSVERAVAHAVLAPRLTSRTRLWEVAYHKCCEVVGKKAIVNILIDDLVNWGKLRQAKKSEYDRNEWLLIYDWCKKEASIPKDPKSLNRWSYNSAVFIARGDEAGCDALTRRLLQRR